MDAVQKANSGHPGMPMGMADVATILFKYFLKYNPIKKFDKKFKSKLKNDNPFAALRELKLK